MSRAGTPGGPVLVSTGFGLLMVLAAGGGADVAARTGAAAALALALALVLAGVFYRPAAALAVLTSAAVLVLAGTPVLFAAVSGLAAAGYLVTRHPAGAGVATMTVPTATAMVAFTLTAVTAAVLPWRPAWVPLLAPGLAVGILVLAGAGLFRAEPVRYE